MKYRIEYYKADATECEIVEKEFEALDECKKYAERIIAEARDEREVARIVDESGSECWTEEFAGSEILMEKYISAYGYHMKNAPFECWECYDKFGDLIYESCGTEFESSYLESLRCAFSLIAKSNGDTFIIS